MGGFVTNFKDMKNQFMKVLPLHTRRYIERQKNTTVEGVIDAFCQMMIMQQQIFEAKFNLAMSQQAPSSTIDDEDDLKVRNLPKGNQGSGHVRKGFSISGKVDSFGNGLNNDRAFTHDDGVTTLAKEPICECGTTSHAHHINCPAHASNLK